MLFTRGSHWAPVCGLGPSPNSPTFRLTDGLYNFMCPIKIVMTFSWIEPPEPFEFGRWGLLICIFTYYIFPLHVLSIIWLLKIYLAYIRSEVADTARSRIRWKQSRCKRRMTGGHTHVRYTVCEFIILDVIA